MRDCWENEKKERVSFMRASVLVGPRQLELREIDTPTTPIDGILVRVMACGICGSDIRSFESGLRGDISEQVMGHEIAGTVEDVGPQAEGFKRGDKVAIAPDVCCGECFYCKKGWVNLCDNHRMIGTHWPGGFAQFLSVDGYMLKHGMVHHMPDELSFVDATMSEPASSVLACQENINVSLGDTVAIIGDGPIGCLHIEVARARGASRVFMSGLHRLDFAEEFHPDLLVDAGSQDPVREILNATKGLGVDHCIVATPVADTQRQGVEIVRKRGTVVLFGGLPRTDPMTTLNGNKIHYEEIRVVGAFSYQARHHRLALDLIRSKKISASKYVTRVVSLTEIEEGIRMAQQGDAMKVVVDPWR